MWSNKVRVLMVMGCVCGAPLTSGCEFEMPDESGVRSEALTVSILEARGAVLEMELEDQLITVTGNLADQSTWFGLVVEARAEQYDGPVPVIITVLLCPIEDFIDGQSEDSSLAAVTICQSGECSEYYPQASDVTVTDRDGVRFVSIDVLVDPETDPLHLSLSYTPPR